MNEDLLQSNPDYLVVLPPPLHKTSPLPEHVKKFIDSAVTEGAKRADRRLSKGILLRQPSERN